MTIKLKRILLVAGRYLKENPYRELVIKHLLETKGVEVILAIPSRGLNKGAAEHNLSLDPVFVREGAIQIDGEWEFRVSMRGCQMVLFSAWRSYLPLAQLARREGRLTMNFNATSGLDHWSHGVDRCLVRSSVTKRMLRIANTDDSGLITPNDENILPVGSIQYENVAENIDSSLLDRATFCAYYGFDPNVKLAILMPKGIGSFHYKVGKWFPQWSSEEVNAYNQQLLDIYAEICRGVKKSGCNLLVKMHPSAYISYNCNSGEEYTYWEQFDWVKVLHPDHTQAMFKHVDVGLGVNTYSAIDMAYFKKPFIYVDSQLLLVPPLDAFKMAHKSILLPKGPSSHWSTGPLESVNPWFPSWLGYYCRAKDLPDLLSKEETFIVDQDDLNRVIKEFWHKNDGNSANRIVDEVIKYGDLKLNDWERMFNLCYWRGLFWDTVLRVRSLLS
ncbi:MAG: hypothetical protein HQL71_15735 [Magnetococcales bacterium]|nr:hypothetical protein [Magnetococcales bacterium]